MKFLGFILYMGGVYFIIKLLKSIYGVLGVPENIWNTVVVPFIIFVPLTLFVYSSIDKLQKKLMDHGE